MTAPPVSDALSGEDVARMRERVAADGVVVFPADTVYGLGCDPDSELAVRRLYELKGRPATRPAAVMFFALHSALRALPDLRPRERAALEALLPGPLTLLLANRARRYPLACGPGAEGSAGPEESAGLEGSAGLEESAGAEGSVGREGSGALGLRVPLLTDRLAALRTLDRPLLQSSANLSGGSEARRLAEVPASIRAGADLVLDGGELPGLASTVLDLCDYERSGQWQIVRAGPVGAAEVQQAIG